MKPPGGGFMILWAHLDSLRFALAANARHSSLRSSS